jgi:hypothetical protein
MNVIKLEHKRAAAGQLLEQRPNRAMKSEALLLHDHHRRRDEPPQCREHTRELRKAVRIQLLARPLCEQYQMSVERVDEQAIGEIALELGGTATQHQPPCPPRLPHSLQQSGLANAGLADKLEHSRRPLLLDGTQQLLDRLALSLSADSARTTPLHASCLQKPSLIPPASKRNTRPRGKTQDRIGARLKRLIGMRSRWIPSRPAPRDGIPVERGRQRR